MQPSEPDWSSEHETVAAARLRNHQRRAAPRRRPACGHVPRGGRHSPRWSLPAGVARTIGSRRTSSALLHDGAWSALARRDVDWGAHSSPFDAPVKNLHLNSRCREKWEADRPLPPRQFKWLWARMMLWHANFRSRAPAIIRTRKGAANFEAVQGRVNRRLLRQYAPQRLAHANH